MPKMNLLLIFTLSVKYQFSIFTYLGSRAKYSRDRCVYDSMNRPKLNLLLIFTFDIINFQFPPTLAGFLDILN